ncbi:hypothetical protein R1sor_006181 [Riccia sorocarpa]|uniref:Uncharacterized protein n=1 Tax=Riccia sorocarpa TaxID=122646 RepID=A0ABD3HQI4_9MARC
MPVPVDQAGPWTTRAWLRPRRDSYVPLSGSKRSLECTIVGTRKRGGREISGDESKAFSPLLLPGLREGRKGVDPGAEFHRSSRRWTQIRRKKVDIIRNRRAGARALRDVLKWNEYALSLGTGKMSEGRLGGSRIQPEEDKSHGSSVSTSTPEGDNGGI